MRHQNCLSQVKVTKREGEQLTIISFFVLESYKKTPQFFSFLFRKNVNVNVNVPQSNIFLIHAKKTDQSNHILIEAF
jgi:hypothetical protein